MSPRRSVALSLVILAVLAATASCGGADDDADVAEPMPVDDALCLDVDRRAAPVVDMIAPAIEAAEGVYGGPQRYFEVSADRQRVSLIVESDGAAEQMFYCGDAGRTPPRSLGEAQGPTFPAESMEVDVSTVFDQLREELDDPQIVDFAVVGAGDDDVVYDATVQSDSGGVLLVLLGPDGGVLAVQAQ